MSSETYYLVGAILTFLGLGFTSVQLWQIKGTRKRQFDQARRNKTAEMVMYYSQNITKETKRAERIVSGFSEEQCSQLYNSAKFTVDKSTRDKICALCPRFESCTPGGKDNKSDETFHEFCKCPGEYTEYVIGDDLLYTLRWHVMRYLNTLESVLLTWQLGIVDQDIIEEQFQFLNRKSQKSRTLEIFRSIAGDGHSYPAIEKFYQYLVQKENDEARQTLKKILE